MPMLYPMTPRTNKGNAIQFQKHSVTNLSFNLILYNILPVILGDIRIR